MTRTKKRDEPHSRAWLALEQNLRSVRHMVQFGAREVRLLHADVARLSNRVAKLTKEGKATPDRLLSQARRLPKRVDARMELFRTATAWQVVLLVTCVETYLEDILCLAAAADPRLMASSEQRATYLEILRSASIDELVDELRARWARKKISRGPRRSIENLSRMGVRFPNDLATRLEPIWGLRHVIVHRAGTATADLVRRHPDLGAHVGQRVRVSLKQFGGYVEAARDFLEPTEAFFLKRYPSLSDQAGDLSVK